MSPSKERRLQRWRRLALVVVLVAVLLLLVAAAGAVARAPGAVAAVALVLLVMTSAAVRALGWASTRVPPATVLTLDLAGPLADLPPDDLRGRLAKRDRPGLRETVETLDRAAGDDRVAGVWCRIGRPAAGLAGVQELRDAVLALRGRGKFAVAFAETFGDGGNGTVAYYLAAAFDEVVLQPSGDLNILGFGTEVRFLRGTLDKLGIQAHVDHRREYKNAADRFTERGFTDAHREAAGRIVETALDQVVAGVAAGRGLTETAVRDLVDQAPLLASDALGAGLVDRLGYRDEALESARARAGGEQARLLPLADYRRRTRRQDGTDHGRLAAPPAGRPGEGTGASQAGGRAGASQAGARRAGPRRGRPRARKVALVYGVGAVVAGRSRFNLLTRRSMGADTVCAALREAARDDGVAAILFRVDSPGGSYIASDAIWRETVRARGAGKPLVVSMGEVAGSGGYFVAMAADRILAQPATLTGSIGVLGGKPVLRDLRERLGATTGAVAAGAHALMWSNDRPFTPEEWDRFQRWLDRCYEDFTGKAAEGRGMAYPDLEALARGRVWVGADAAERGLVDALGGYAQALAEIRALLDLAPDHPLEVVPYPRRIPPLAQLLGRRPSPGDDELGTAAAWAGDLLPSAAGLVAGLGFAGGDAALLMPDPWHVGLKIE